MSRRAKWKGPFINSFFLHITLVEGSDFVKTRSRNTVILPYMVGKNIKIYNGKRFHSLKIIKEMIGFKLGEFSFTRLRHKYKKKKKIKKWVKK